MTLIVPILSRSLTMALPRESIAKRKQDVPRVTRSSGKRQRSPAYFKGDSGIWLMRDTHQTMIASALICFQSHHWA